MITIVCQHIMGGHKSLVARKCCQQGEVAIQAPSLKVVFREFSLSGLPSGSRPGKNSFLVRVLCGAPSAGWRSSAAANAKVTAAQLLLNSREAGQGRSFVRLVMKLSCVATRHQLSNTEKLYSDNLFPAAFFYCCKSRLPNKELSDERNIQSS